MGPPACARQRFRTYAKTHSTQSQNYSTNGHSNCKHKFPYTQTLAHTPSFTNSPKRKRNSLTHCFLYKTHTNVCIKCNRLIQLYRCHFLYNPFTLLLKPLLFSSQNWPRALNWGHLQKKKVKIACTNCVLSDYLLFTICQLVNNSQRHLWSPKCTYKLLTSGPSLNFAPLPISSNHPPLTPSGSLVQRNLVAFLESRWRWLEKQ